jgi:hypothetical protein
MSQMLAGGQVRDGNVMGLSDVAEVRGAETIATTIHAPENIRAPIIDYRRSN